MASTPTVSISQSPPGLLLSRNPILYKIAANNVDPTAQVHWQLHDAVFNTLIAESTYTCAAYWTGSTLPPVINVQLNVYVEKMIDANIYDMFYRPFSPSTSDIQTNYIKFYLRCRVIQGGFTSAWATEGINHIAIKGGVGILNQDAYIAMYGINSYFPQISLLIPNFPQQWLTWIPSGRKMRHDEYGWLTYISMVSNNNQSPYYVVKYLDGSTTTWVDPTWPTYPDSSYMMYTIPMGIEQASLDPTNKGVAYYDIQVRYDSTNQVISTYRINVDNSAAFRNLTIYYRNSYGALDHLSFEGVIEDSTVSTKLSYHRPRWANEPGFPMQSGSDPYYQSGIQPKWKMNTGFISYKHMIAMNELLNTNYCAIRNGHNYLPINCPPQTVTWRKSTDNLYSADILFETSGTYDGFPQELLTLFQQ